MYGSAQTIKKREILGKNEEKKWRKNKELCWRCACKSVITMRITFYVTMEHNSCYYSKTKLQTSKQTQTYTLYKLIKYHRYAISFFFVLACLAWYVLFKNGGINAKFVVVSPIYIVGLAAKHTTSRTTHKKVLKWENNNGITTNFLPPLFFCCLTCR